MNSISNSNRISNTINRYLPGNIFTYADFNVPKQKKLALAKSLSRLEKKGEIVRMEKGKYYRPRETTFGNLKPDVDQTIKILTKKDDKTTGYPTGVTVYNQMGLTSQMANIIIIATPNLQPAKEVNGYRVKFSKRDFEIEENDVPLLQLLDALKDIKKIPDTSPDEAIKVIISKLQNLSVLKMKRFAKLALNYNAATRALVGALIEKYFKGISVFSLYKSLNVLSKYELKISVKLLPNQAKWNIE